jgi:hypothetical protein
MILPVSVNPVGFKRITAVWAKYDSSSAWAEGTDYFGDGFPIILYMFDHFVAEDQVKRRRGKRELFPGSVQNVRGIDPCFNGALKIIFQSDDCASKIGKVFDVHPHTASVLKNLPLDAIPCGMDDHIESALLPIPPDVRRLAPQSGLVKVT